MMPCAQAELNQRIDAIRRHKQSIAVEATMLSAQEKRLQSMNTAVYECCIIVDTEGHGAQQGPGRPKKIKTQSASSVSSMSSSPVARSSSVKYASDYIVRASSLHAFSLPVDSPGKLKRAKVAAMNVLDVINERDDGCKATLHPFWSQVEALMNGVK
jgi:hypothetical protein